MVFHSTQIRGKGRGKKIGFPTINLRVPPGLELDEGVYAAWVFIEGKSFKGALHFGPVPVFNELRRSLEINLLNNPLIPDLSGKIIVKIVKKIREIMNFNSVEDMVERINNDIGEIREILDKHSFSTNKKKPSQELT